MRHTPFINELLDKTVAILESDGPQTAEQLAPRLSMLDVVDDPVSYLEDVLTGCSRVTELRDGRFLSTKTVLNGLTLTRRLTAVEIESGRVKVDPDLWALVMAYESLPSAHGDVIVDREAEQHLAGPPGWLGEARPGETLAFHLRDGTLEAWSTSPDPVETARVAGELRAAFEARRDGQPFIYAAPIILWARANGDAVFDTPVAPVSELARRVGLEMRMDLIGVADDATWGPDKLFNAFLSDELGLDECCRELLRAFVSEFARWQAGEPEEAIRREMLAEIIGHGDVASALVDFGLSEIGLDAVALDRFVERLVVKARGESLAACRFVQASCADRVDDPETAERHLREALRADAGHPLALAAAASYAEDRGDASRALEYLRRAGVEDDGRIDRLLHYCAPGPFRAERNELCPCGSGRKHKVCCWARGGFDLPSRARWLYEKACSFAMRPSHAHEIADLIELRHPTGVESPSDIDLDNLLDVALFEGAIFTRFLDVRGVLLPADELELGRTWVGSRRRLWRIDRSARDGMELRDLVSGETRFVSVRNSSHKLAKGALLDARVVPNGRGHCTVGPVAMVPLGQRDALTQLYTSAPDAAQIAAFNAQQGSIILVTKENEPVVMCEATYEIDDAPAACRALAKALDETGDGSYAEIVRLGAEDVARGWVDVDTSSLTITASAEPRLERLRETVLRAVPGARLKSETRTPARQLLRGAGQRTDDKLMADTVITSAVRDHMRAYEERWVDEAVPALGGLTPRQALADPSMREDLETLLAEMEVRKGGMSARRIRSLLGMTRPRRPKQGR